MITHKPDVQEYHAAQHGVNVAARVSENLQQCFPVSARDQMIVFVSQAALGPDLWFLFRASFNDSFGLVPGVVWPEVCPTEQTKRSPSLLNISTLGQSR